MTRLVQQDVGVGIDDTSCRDKLLPKITPAVVPGDNKSNAWPRKLPSACQGRLQPAGQDGLTWPAPRALQHS